MLTLSRAAPSIRENAFSTPLSSQIAMHIGTPISCAFCSAAAIAARAASAVIVARCVVTFMVSLPLVSAARAPSACIVDQQRPRVQQPRGGCCGGRSVWGWLGACVARTGSRLRQRGSVGWSDGCCFGECTERDRMAGVRRDDDLATEQARHTGCGTGDALKLGEVAEEDGRLETVRRGREQRQPQHRLANEVHQRGGDVFATGLAVVADPRAGDDAGGLAEVRGGGRWRDHAYAAADDLANAEVDPPGVAAPRQGVDHGRVGRAEQEPAETEQGATADARAAKV